MTDASLETHQLHTSASAQGGGELKRVNGYKHGNVSLQWDLVNLNMLSIAYVLLII